MIQDDLRQSLSVALRALDITVPPMNIALEHPTVAEHGDFSSNIAMKLAARTRQSPLSLAQKIVAHLPSIPSVNKVDAVAPGFINFRLSSDCLWSEVEEILSKKELYGMPRQETKQRVLIEHTQVNPNKEPHVGHLRNTCIGDVLARLYRAAGFDTKVLYYQNDVGQQIASLVLAARKQYIQHDDFPSLIAWASLAYADIERRMTEDANLVTEKNAIQVRIAEQNTEEASVAHELTTQILQETLRTLAELGVEYDLVVQESDILKHKLWEQTFALLNTKSAFYLAQDGEKKGCWLIKMPNAEDKIIVRSNGVPTYVGNDIANHLWKFGILKDFTYQKLDWKTQQSPLYITSVGEGERRSDFSPADIIVNVIDQTQTYPQQSVIESLRVLGYENAAKNYHHVNYGFVYLSRKTALQLGIEVPEGAQQVKISGRKGSVVSISNFLMKMADMLHATYGDFSTINAVRNGAIKFELLKYNTYQDVVFDLDAALDIKGFSGPYVQYAFTRASNVLRKAEASKRPAIDQPQSLDDGEQKILRMIYRFPEVALAALREHSPHYICLFLFELAQLFNGFYEQCRIIGSDREAERVQITGAVAQVFRNGLFLLGIEAPEKM